MMKANPVVAVAVATVLILSASCALAAGVSISIPDTTASRGETIWVPVYASDVTDSGVYSYQLIMSFDSTFAEIVDVSCEGGIADVGSWMDPVWFIKEGEDSLRVAGAGTDGLSGEGLLVLVGVNVLESAPADSMYLGLHEVVLNEGTPDTDPDGGWLSISCAGVDDLPGSDEAGPLRIERLAPATIRWSLVGVDSQGASLRIYDAFGRLVTLLNPVGSEQAASFIWKGDNSAGEAVSGGVYFYRLESGGSSWTGKVCILK
jgi:hypothetical protein